MKKYRVVWTTLAKKNLRSVKRYIAQHDPHVATAFVKRIRDRASKLRTLPNAGVPVENPHRPDLREFFVGNYRVVYRVGDDVVEIILVIHGAKLLDDDLP